jgi:hypothetical protein
MAAMGDAAGVEGFGPLAAIRHDFPGWHAWRSSAGRFWATRMERRRRPDDAPVQWALTVDGDTPDDLRRALAAQAGP